MIYYVYLLVAIILLNMQRSNDQNPQCIFNIMGGHYFNDTKSDNRKQPVIKYVPNRIIGRKQEIPYIIFQTHEMDVVPWKMKYGISSVIEKNPQYTYRYYNATQRRNFIKNTFDQITLLCYDSLQAKAFQADLFRYLIIYHYGGCYIDTSFLMSDSFVSTVPPHTTFYTSIDKLYGNYSLSNGYFCSQSGNGILYNVINLSLRAITKYSYESGMFDVTGPDKLAQAFKIYYNTTQILPGIYNQGETIIFQRNYIFPCMLFSYLRLDNSILFYTRYPDYRWDVQHYVNSPHYSNIYESRTLYNISIKMPIQDYTFPVLYKRNFQQEKTMYFPFLKHQQ